MSLKIKALAAAGPLVLLAGAAIAAPFWHVVAVPERHACYRVTTLPAGEGWRDMGRFNTFRQAGAWEWRNRAICLRMG